MAMTIVVRTAAMTKTAMIETMMGGTIATPIAMAGGTLATTSIATAGMIATKIGTAGGTTIWAMTIRAPMTTDFGTMMIGAGRMMTAARRFASASGLPPASAFCRRS